jgi:hypothetical protein
MPCLKLQGECWIKLTMSWSCIVFVHFYKNGANLENRQGDQVMHISHQQQSCCFLSTFSYIYNQFCSSIFCAHVFVYYFQTHKHSPHVENLNYVAQFYRCDPYLGAIKIFCTYLLFCFLFESMGKFVFWIFNFLLAFQNKWSF